MKTKFLLFLLPLVTVLFSCKEEIELVGEFQETAIVYGLLDQADSVHLIKITRAFIGPGNSLDIAQVADSSYFDAVDATMMEYVNDVPTGRSWTLKDTIINNKNTSGVFYGPEQKLYVFYSQGIDNSGNPTGEALRTDATYRLNAVINGGEFAVSGETGLVSGISTNTDSQSYSFKFAKNANEFKSLTLVTNVGNAHVVNAALDIHYTEFIGATEIKKTATWKLGEVDCQPGDNKQFTAYGETFYEQIAQHCASYGDPLVDKRNFTGLTVRIVGGADDLYKYMLVNQPSSSLAQNKPTYTNLSATNGHSVIGVFSARFTREVYHEFSTTDSQFLRCLDKASTEILCIGAITGPYLFCSQHAQDLLPSPESWACN